MLRPNRDDFAKKRTSPAVNSNDGIRVENEMEQSFAKTNQSMAEPSK